LFDGLPDKSVTETKKQPEKLSSNQGLPVVAQSALKRYHRVFLECTEQLLFAAPMSNDSQTTISLDICKQKYKHNHSAIDKLRYNFKNYTLISSS